MIVAKLLSVTAFLLLSGHASSEYNLTIVHISDFHSHWFEFNEREGKCSDEESKAGSCFGGFPRLLNLVRDIRKKEKNVIVLSSGEFFLGRSLNVLHGWKIASALLPKLDLDAMSLSNHDFSSGIFELSTFLYGMKFPVLCANMWARETSFLYSRVNKSAVLDINGEKIGIIGYLHPETLEKSKKAVSVKFFPEIPAINEEVKRLESYGINKIIALGHSGYHTDLKIAKEVKGIDVVIGGNSDIVLEEPYDDEAEVRTDGNIHGNYPRVHHHEDSNATEAELKNKTLVLHIPQHGKYVGIIQVTFDEHGRVIHEEGKPVLLDSSVPQDLETLNYLKNAHSTLEEVARNVRLPDDSEVLAQGEVEFESRKCRMQECSLGNLVTDAMLQVYQDNKHIVKPPNDPEKWGHVDAVVFNAGSIRYPLPSGNITIKDLVHSLFVGDFMRIVYMNGEQLVKMMEHSVEKYDSTGVTAPGSFLQIAGLRVVYDLSDSPGKRVKKLLMLCKNCVNDYEEVDPRQTYNVAMPEFISKGGDGYPKFQAVNSKDIGQPEILLIVQYLRKVKLVKPVLDGRISFLNELYPKNHAMFTKSEVPTTLKITSTKKMDNSLLVTPTQGSEKKITPSSTTEKSDKEQIRFQTTAKHMFAKDKSTYSFLASELENKAEMAPLSADKRNSTSMLTTTTGTEKFNSTTLVAPQSITKTMESKSNHSNIHHVELEKSFSYVSLMLGRDSEHPTAYSPKERFLKINNESVSEKNISKEKLPGTIKETKPDIENIKERNAVLSLKDEAGNDAANLSSPVEKNSEENVDNVLVENHVEFSSTRRDLDPATHTVEDTETSTESKLHGNDTVTKASPVRTFSANNTDPMTDYVSIELAGNVNPIESEVFEVNLNEENSENTTNSQEVSSVSVSGSGETLPKNYSQLSEIKKKFASFVQNSSMSETGKVLLNAALAEVNEDQVIIDDGDLDRISNNLKTMMSNFLQDKISVTTMTSVEGELATIISDHFNRGPLNFTQPHSIKEPSTEADPATEKHFTEPLTADSIPASTEINNDKQLKNDRILNGSYTIATNSSSFKSEAEEIKDMLVNSVVNSVLDQMKTEYGQNLLDINSSVFGNSSGDISKKRRIVKKQLKPLDEEMTPNAAGEFSTDSTTLTSTLNSKTNAEESVERIQVFKEKKLNKPKMMADVEDQQESLTLKSDSQKEKEDSHKAVYWWFPWKFIGF